MKRKEIMTTIDSMADLQTLVREGWTDWEEFGFVNAKEKDGLILFNYNIAATLLCRWNWFERNARGLILNRKTGEVVARPFEKIFNWGEGNGNVLLPLEHTVTRITEKMDGSLGILYRPLRNRVGGRRYAIATRGSFDSDQAKWATDLLYYHNDIIRADLPDECTLLFEIIYPENQIVVDYSGKRMLVLLAARNCLTGEYYDDDFLTHIAEKYKFIQPLKYDFSQNAQVIRTLVSKWDQNIEGVVAEFEDGSRWKFKADAYVKVHRLLGRLSFKRILESVREGTIDDTLPLLPLHLRKGVLATMAEIAEVRQRLREHVYRVFAQASTPCSRKEYAAWVLTFHKDISMYLFRVYDNQELDQEIWKHAFVGYTPKVNVITETLDID